MTGPELISYAEALAELRDQEIEGSDEAHRNGLPEYAREQWGAARAYRLALSALHHHTHGAAGVPLGDQPNPAWVAALRSTLTEGTP